MQLTWKDLIPLIIRYGTEYGRKIWELVNSNAEPTSADWDALQALADKSYDQYIEDARKRAGLPPAQPSPQPASPPVPPAPTP